VIHLNAKKKPIKSRLYKFKNIANHSSIYRQIKAKERARQFKLNQNYKKNHRTSSSVSCRVRGSFKGRARRRDTRKLERTPPSRKGTPRRQGKTRPNRSAPLKTHLYTIFQFIHSLFTGFEQFLILYEPAVKFFRGNFAGKSKYFQEKFGGGKKGGACRRRRRRRTAAAAAFFFARAAPNVQGSPGSPFTNQKEKQEQTITCIHPLGLLFKGAGQTWHPSTREMILYIYNCLIYYCNIDVCIVSMKNSYTLLVAIILELYLYIL
jgi:hypothetical protein